jgi:HEAT repeat protein
VTIVDRLRTSALDERLAAIAELAAHEHPEPGELQALAACLGSPPKVLQRHAAEAFAALHRQGVAVTALLLAGLQAPDRQQRWGAAYALSRIGPAPAQALPVLLECLGVDDGDLRWAAADILVHMARDTHLVGALQQLLADGNPAQRKMAAYCLRDLEVRTPAVEQAVRAALADAAPGVRMAAILGLARLGSERAALALQVAAMLTDADAGVRRAAAAALGTLGESTEPVLAALHAAAASPDPSLQRAATGALHRLRECRGSGSR